MQNLLDFLIVEPELPRSTVAVFSMCLLVTVKSAARIYLIHTKVNVYDASPSVRGKFFECTSMISMDNPRERLSLSFQ